jgi:hypothetical protein
MKAIILFQIFIFSTLVIPCHLQGSECVGRFQDGVPGYAQIPHYRYPYPPPISKIDYYHSALAWANVILGRDSYGTTGSVIVRKLELWEITGNSRKIIAEKLLCEGCTDPKDLPFGYLWPISQWTQDTSWAKENEGYKFIITAEKYIEAPVNQNPDMIYHFWQANWPRPNTNPGSTYAARAEVLVTGNAMINIGFDHYEQIGSGGNKEGASSKWVCADPGWQEVIAGDFGSSQPPIRGLIPPLTLMLLNK